MRKKTFNPAEIAEIMKVDRSSVYRWINQGLLPAVRIGRTVRIKEEDFEKIFNTTVHTQYVCKSGKPV